MAKKQKEPKKETYLLKLKDKPGREGKIFYKLDGSPFILKQIYIRKVPGENNKFWLELTEYDGDQ